MRVICPVHFIFVDLIILIILGENNKLGYSTSCSFLQTPITSFLFGPNILLSTLFSNTRSLCISLNVRDQVSHPHCTSSCKHNFGIELRGKPYQSQSLSFCFSILVSIEVSGIPSRHTTLSEKLPHKLGETRPIYNNEYGTQSLPGSVTR
jgi:hypothetical protein